MSFGKLGWKVEGSIISDILIALGLGAAAGVIDIIPMILKKLDHYSVFSAFMQWVVLGVLIRNTSIFGLSGWINGAATALLAAIPIVILVAKSDKKSVGVILICSGVLGGLLGVIFTYI